MLIPGGGGGGGRDMGIYHCIKRGKEKYQRNTKPPFFQTMSGINVRVLKPICTASDKESTSRQVFYFG